jgi:hypothetical protein
MSFFLILVSRGERRLLQERPHFLKTVLPSKLAALAAAALVL